MQLWSALFSGEGCRAQPWEFRGRRDVRNTQGVHAAVWLQGGSAGSAHVKQRGWETVPS